ncbi:uncharacterized protein PHACADRAFT_191212 [Phanerochaete carnosa HHB-10118-sp]|uniref:Uncharacterized protein n=1 Tax=Phanerochaete carnosa (strain HHB-10118-sp) TaxID=650164 RepID=K5V810_PHACS|nr:uncharacterized protein PHACADRAFT_191212 [Phanerochaete carnosa HHB-10118-sp]EKM58901.1 hypothetical protein PHACADRAFT_191212 [Phanerochaete carnosa HHB-10118-sp]
MPNMMVYFHTSQSLYQTLGLRCLGGVTSYFMDNSQALTTSSPLAAGFGFFLGHFLRSSTLNKVHSGSPYCCTLETGTGEETFIGRWIGVFSGSLSRAISAFDERECRRSCRLSGGTKWTPAATVTSLVAPLVVAAPIIAAATAAYEKCNIVLSASHAFKLLSKHLHVSRTVLMIGKGSSQPFSSCGQRCARRPVESDMGGNDADRSAVFSSV